MTIFFNADEVDHLISLPEAVGLAERALRDLAEGRAVNAPRRRLHLHYDGEVPYDTRLNIYAGGSSGYGALGAQVAIHRVTTVRGSVQTHLQNHPGQTEMALTYDGASGELLAIMAHRPRHAAGLADLRTPASSLAGLSRLARADASRVGVFGSGHQAFSTLMGVLQLLPIASVRVFSPTPAHRELFARRMSEATGVPVEAVDEPREVVRDVDIVLCMTNTNVPVLDGSWLSPGQYLVSVIGSNIDLVRTGNLKTPRREIDDATLRRSSRLVVLSKAQAVDDQQGDVYLPIQQGVLGWDRVSEMPAVLAEQAPGRLGDDEILVYKNNGGQGVVDIAIAHRCYQLAVERGVGVELPIRPQAADVPGGGWRNLT